MRLRLFFAALLCALALPVAANAAGLSGYCAQPDAVSVERSAPGTWQNGLRVDADDPLAIVPVAQYACSNSCRRACYRASQSCRASRRTCQRRLSSCIRSCGC